MFLPLFEASGYKQGFLSGQVDPRSCFDYDAMLAQALEIHAVNPNVMVKCPGTKQGYQLIEELTSRGIADQQHAHVRPVAASRLRQDRACGASRRPRPTASTSRSGAR